MIQPKRTRLYPSDKFPSTGKRIENVGYVELIIRSITEDDEISEEEYNTLTFENDPTGQCAFEIWYMKNRTNQEIEVEKFRILYEGLRNAPREGLTSDQITELIRKMELV